MNLGDLWERAVDLLSYLETDKARQLIMDLDQQDFMILVGATVGLVIICVIKGMIRTATLVVTVCAVVVLLHFTIPEKGQPMGLYELIWLFGGGTFIVASAIYFMFIRAD
jgi:hypothetical protein